MCVYMSMSVMCVCACVCVCVCVCVCLCVCAHGSRPDLCWRRQGEMMAAQRDRQSNRAFKLASDSVRLSAPPHHRPLLPLPLPLPFSSSVYVQQKAKALFCIALPSSPPHNPSATSLIHPTELQYWQF